MSETWQRAGFWMIVVGAALVAVAIIIILLNISTASTPIVVHKPVPTQQQV